MTGLDALTAACPARGSGRPAPPAYILRRLPGVAEVEALVTAPRPARRIVHLRDWHYVPPDLFALDARQAAGRALSDEEVAGLYQEHLLEVELVSTEQVALLRCLVKHHGLRRVLAEGLTPGGLPTYLDILAALRDTDPTTRRARSSSSRARRERYRADIAA